jgi:thiaminase/transcriptional activator TenA
MTSPATTGAAAAAQAPGRAGWTGQLWAEIAGTYAAILGHPFIQGLTSGDLPPAAFFYYISQDDHYVREFVKAVALVGAKAPGADAARLLTKHASDGLSAESTLHQVLVADLGGDPAALAQVQAGPTTQAYTSYVLATVFKGDFAEGLAAVLPCMWIYGEVGRHLHQQGSPNPVYQRWIDTYAGPEYAAEVAAVLDLADQAGSDLTGAQEARARGHFAAGARYEWMFWDAAWRQEAWPI